MCNIPLAHHHPASSGPWLMPAIQVRQDRISCRLPCHQQWGTCQCPPAALLNKKADHQWSLIFVIASLETRNKVWHFVLQRGHEIRWHVGGHCHFSPYLPSLDFFHLTKFGNFDRVRWKRKMCFVKLNTECLNPLTRIYLDNLIVDTPSSAPYKNMVSLIDMA